MRLRVVEVSEPHPPAGQEPLRWCLLTTHQVQSLDEAWQIVGWYKQRWTIEQLFRTLKKQGLRLEDSQLETADRLLKLTAIATHAAALIMQLVQARDGKQVQPASIAFTDNEIAALRAIEADQYAPRTAKQQTAGAHHLQTWPPILPRHRKRLDPQKCVNPLASYGRGEDSSAARYAFFSQPPVAVCCQ